jgi:predicted CXXCH cytochrome family protein
MGILNFDPAAKPGRGSVRVALPAILVLSIVCVILPLDSPAYAQQQQPPSEIEPATCLNAGCHAGMKDKQVVHSPLKKGDCETCHEQADVKVHKFKYAETSAALCYLCHDSLTEKKKFVHQPLKEEGNACVLCHDPHSSGMEALVKAKTKLDLCVRCHSDISGSDALHQSDDQTCTDCHDPHASDESTLLRTRTPDLCFKCHSDLRDDIKQSAVVHGPVAAGCTVCHSPHRTLGGKGLLQTGEKLCMTCHEHFKETLEAMSTRHPQLLSGDSCGRCHEPHVGQHEHLLRDTPFGLCLSCHSKEITAQDGRTIASLAELKNKDVVLHGPLSGKQCSPCHQAHGSLSPGFLAGAYPTGFYSPYSEEGYGLCFGCHGSELAEEAETASETNFRNGTRNLHFVHVNKERKGRSCRVCHLPHGGKTPHFLADTVAFGNWKLPIGFVPSDDGGTCKSGCHAEKQYSRGEGTPLAAPKQLQTQPTPH